MLRITIQLEDTVIAADAAADAAEVGMWHVLIQDGCSGRHHPCQFNNIQLGAIIALAVGLGEDTPKEYQMVVEWLYKVARDALTVAECPDECWPIP